MNGRVGGAVVRVSIFNRVATGIVSSGFGLWVVGRFFVVRGGVFVVVFAIIMMRPVVVYMTGNTVGVQMAWVGVVTGTVMNVMSGGTSHQ